MSRRYQLAVCDDPDCGWSTTVGQIIPASRIDPSFVDGDWPDDDRCPDCQGPIHADTDSGERDDY